jgi:hypothetical protein
VAKQILLAGTTSRREYIYILDSTSTTGAGKTGLTSATAGWKVYYVRPGAAPALITLVSAVANQTTAFTSASFTEIDATNMPGLYRFDVPDAVFAAGADKAVVMLSGPTGVAPVTLEYQLTSAGESWIASGVWSAQVASYATAGTGETLGTDTYGTKVCRTTTANRNISVSGTQAVTLNAASVTAATFGDDALVIGAAAGTGVKIRFAADAITSTVIATDAITNAELATTAVTEIAAGVWDEAYASHTTAGTFGKLMDLLRKANLVTEATVSTSGSPANSTSFFRTSLTGADNFYNNQQILFTSGTLSGQSAVISAYTSTNGAVQLSDSLTATPTAGDSFVVQGSHIWTREQIADGIYTRSLTAAGSANYINITSISSSVFQAINTLAVDDQVTFVGTAPTSYVVGTVYWVISTSLTSTTFQLSTTQGGLGNATVSTGAFTAVKVTSRDLLSAIRYLRNKVAINSSTMTVYAEDDVTAAWTAALTSTAGVNPVTTVDPN